MKSACFHCGEAIPAGFDLNVTIDGTSRPMCCVGCASIAKAIVDAGATSYYSQRKTAGLDITTLESLAPWASLLEDPQWMAQHVQPMETRIGAQSADTGSSETSSQPMQTTLAIEGLRCGACAWLIEKILAQTPGVIQATANASSARLLLRWDASQTSLSKIAHRVAAIGYALLPIGSAPVEASRKTLERTALRRLFVAGLSSAQIMMYAYPEYLEGSGLDDDVRSLMRTASMLITVPVMLYSATPFFESAWRMLRAKRLGMDVPVSLGLWIAFIASMVAWWTNEGEVYFDSVSMFVFLLLGARWVEAKVRARTSAQRDRLATAPPNLAHRISPDAADVAAWNLKIGDVVRVNSGDRIPADGILRTASTEIDNAWITGESLPATVVHGDRVTEGAINLGPAIEVLIDTPASEGTISRLSRLAEQAASDRPQWVAWADTIGARFTAAILLVAGLLAVYSIATHTPTHAWISSLIAVLVVTCPCALSMAGPAAYAAALAKLLESGIAVSSSAVLERTAMVTDVVFDKTGTLTDPTQSSVRMAFGEPLLWPAVHAIAMQSRHPLAVAIASCAQIELQKLEIATAPSLQEARQHAGLGISGKWQGQDIRLGSASFTDPTASQRHLMDQHPEATVFLAIDGVVRAGFVIEDTARAEAQTLIQGLQGQGITVWMLSGDRTDRVTRLAQQLGVPQENTLAQMRPEAKQEKVSGIQAQGRIVMMVGDGHNDAPVLAQADVSIAVRSAAPLARQKADVYLLSAGLHSVRDVLAMAQGAKRTLNQNLVWAVAYNIVAIPFAAAGMISPLVASIGMASSSLLVVLNSSRLLRARRAG